jgi:hypothetical protein
MALPVTFEDRDGETRDVSASGVYFSILNDPPYAVTPGTPIRLRLQLEHVDPGGPLEVVCDGEVVRVEQDDRRAGIAVRIDSYQFEVSRSSGVSAT